MQFEKQDDEEMEMLLGQIPHATSLPFHHREYDNNLRYNHLQNHGRGCGGAVVHGDVRNANVPGYSNGMHQYIVYGDKVHGGSRVQSVGGHGDSTNNHRIHHHPVIYEHELPYPGNVCAPAFSPGGSPSSSFSGGSYSSGSSSSSSFSGGFSPEERGSPVGPLNDYSLRLPATDYSGGFHCSSGMQQSDYQMGLSDKFRAMRILDEKGNSYGSFLSSNRDNVMTNRSADDYMQDYSNHCSQPPISAANLATEERRLLMLRLQQHYQMGDFIGSARSSRVFSNQAYDNPMSFSWQDEPRAFHSPTEPGFVGVPSHQQHNASNSGRDGGSCRSFNQYPGVRHPKPSPGIGHCRNLPQYGLPVHPGAWSSQSHTVVNIPGNAYGYQCEGSYILQERGLRDESNRYNRGFPHNSSVGNFPSMNFELDSDVGSSPSTYNSPPIIPVNYNSLTEIRGYIYFLAKDQHGCRFLQRKIEEKAPEDVQVIFNEIIDHVVELMINPFGNYLIQKLLEVCNEDQRLQILLVITRDPGRLVNISLNTHGTRAVQKMIETLKTRQQISLVVSALEPGFLNLMKDSNGNHVVQRCLQCLSSEENKFIFCAAAKYCVDIATHRHGCCVLQNCIAIATGKHKEKLISEISANGFILAQDPFGNYVVQCILYMKIPSVTATLISQFEGNYVHLSQQKFSSNVVERCLQVFGEDSRARIIHELLSTSQFDKLLQHPFANYVIYRALTVAKGPLLVSLIEAIRPHAATLRNNPYCKRIISRSFAKK